MTVQSAREWFRSLKRDFRYLACNIGALVRYSPYTLGRAKDKIRRSRGRCLPGMAIRLVLVLPTLGMLVTWVVGALVYRIADGVDRLVCPTACAGEELGRD